MLRLTLSGAVLGLFVLLWACSEGPPAEISAPDDVQLSHVNPVAVDGNPTCESLIPGSIELKVDPVEVGENTASDAYLSVTVTTSDDMYFDWSATKGVDAVIAKGGSSANVYYYDPEETEDTGLHPQINPTNSTPYGISHVTFCYDIELEVSKTAETTFTREHDWDIEKDADATTVTLQQSQASFTVEYALSVVYLGSTDSDWGVSGTITILNPHPSAAAQVTDVADSFDGGSDITVQCYTDPGMTNPVGIPTSLAAGATLTCAYSGTSDGTEGTNTATATTDGSNLIGGGSGTATFAFTTPTTELNACAYVADPLLGITGYEAVCAGGLSTQAVTTLTSADIPSLSMNLAALQSVQEATCGADGVVTLTNVASVYGEDPSLGGDPIALSDDDHTIEITVTCGPDACTLTQGYWKTHSAMGPAPYDEEGWGALGDYDGDTTPEQEQESLFGFGTWYDVFWTAPKGDAWYQLAHQYMAAYLNAKNGATMDGLAAQFAAAEAILAGGQGLKGKDGRDAKDLAGYFAEFNEGSTGPGHCDEN